MPGPGGTDFAWVEKVGGMLVDLFQQYANVPEEAPGLQKFVKPIEDLLDPFSDRELPLLFQRMDNMEEYLNRKRMTERKRAAQFEALEASGAPSPPPPPHTTPTCP